MKIVPIDIAHKTFGRKVMGYDPEEVMGFLKKIADELEQMVAERNTLRESVREKELSIIEYRERDELLKNTITTATKMSDRIHTDAEREARLIIGDANQKARMITEEAKNSLKSIYEEITDLQKIRLQFENNLRALIQSHLTMLEQGRKIMPSPTDSEETQSESKTEEEVIKENVHRVVERAANNNLNMDL